MLINPEQIKLLRATMGLTLQEFAEKLGDCSAQSVSKWERGEQKPKHQTVRKMVFLAREHNTPHNANAGFFKLWEGHGPNYEAFNPLDPHKED